ncbi:MAG: polyribonucleotide nucleotidyltransferase [Roseibacillus sp.]|jgi:polyribonucleotide nucleotidyltransferase|nr:polyribonucleotide nucleotidyltransferase [Roseibacillus sp.]MBP35526.1 polyribonucleotide nucleotidyltransferase [Roseibacillus sp.]MCP4731614.1 polyribonucleotide nucleotidyltransferase [Roseibacillus sp.]HJM63794.1 polyribonucleotide nucleotidyltransferase [Roseibacillus sp.]|tara:strand:- start:20181 stop:22499 length:2319 start_codon:yes stop_codon:yes gene_type:complete
MSTHTVTADVGQTPIVIETGKLAKLADGAVTVRCGDTVVLVTAVSQTKIREGQTWFPMSVEYKERAAAAGVFPGGYFKREGRPTEKEILTCRMTDRPLRPLFPKGYLYDTQIIAILFAADGENDADIAAMNGASAALAISDIPFAGPIGAVRVGRVEGDFVVNPTFEQRAESDLDLVYVGNKTDVVMIEGAADEIPEADFVDALRFAQGHVTKLVEVQEELVAQCGKEKRDYTVTVAKDEHLEIGYRVAGDRIEDAIYKPSKVERAKAVGALRDEVEAALKEADPEITDFAIEQAFEHIQKKAFRISILEKGLRADGRQVGDLRPLTAEAGLLPRVHGSGLFARGETQALATTTLAPADEKQFVDNYAGGDDSKHFLLHYSFPPFSVGESGRYGGLNRREIGHGALCERSLAAVIPDVEEFPYAIRVTSEVLESNGSSSMATVCSGTMSLLQAGVPLKRPVSGISVGLVTDYDDDGNLKDHKLLMDIIGSEDFYGDMDWKLCGTSEGITGFQLDLKLRGVPMDIFENAVHMAKEGRTKVQEAMSEAISEVGQLSEHAPRIETVKIDPDRIGELIGPGGKHIKGIQAESGAEINIEDDGTVHIYAAKAESLECAKKMIEDMFAEVEVGTTYTGKIVNTMAFGAFMEVLPGKDGLVHISELAEGRVEKTEDVVKTGDVVTAKCIGVDEKGRVKMSMRAAIREARGESPDSGDSDERGGDRGRRSGGGGGGGRRGGDGRDRDRGGDRGGRDRNRDKPKDDVPPPEKEESFSLTDD